MKKSITISIVAVLLLAWVDSSVMADFSAPSDDSFTYLGGKGDLSGSDAIVWQVNEPTTPYVPSPLLYDGRIYVCENNNEVISCYNAKTGTPHFVEQKMDEMKGVYASPAAAAGRIYCVGRNGVSCVLKASDSFEVLAVNTLDDKIDCSPAFVGDEMYLKGKQNLYCIAASN